MALVPQIVDALKKEIQDKSIPVVAAGGIADGRGLLAALALGSIRNCNRHTFFGMS